MLDILYYPPNLRFVGRKSDFPTPIGGTITLPAGSNWLLTKDVDLTGDRIVCEGVVSIKGESSETAFLRSTGLIGTPLITTQYSLPIQNLSIVCDTAFDIDGTGMPESIALDWFALNIIDCPNIGTIKNVGNFIINTSTWINSGGCVLDGTLGTVSFGTSLFLIPAGVIGILLTATCVITRRLRAFKSTFSVGALGVAYDLVAGYTLPTDMFVLDDVGFAGASTTFIVGTTPTNNQNRWTGCRGIQNDFNGGSYSMQNNAAATVIAATNTYVKAAGVTTAGELQRFTHTDNRLTYTGLLMRTMDVRVSLSFTAGTNNVILARIQRYNSLNVLVSTSPLVRSTASAAGRAENIALFYNTPIAQGDYIELWVANSTAVTNIVVSELILAANAIS